MAKYFSLAFSLVCAFFLAQNTRFVYQVSMKTDSTAAPTVENAYLDISANQSFFYGEKRIQRDSIMRKAVETKNFSFDRTQMEQYRTKIDYVVEKNLSAQKITYKTELQEISIPTTKTALLTGKFCRKQQK